MSLIGDLNLDGIITFEDVLLLYNYVNNVPGFFIPSFYVADINNDGVVDFNDVLLLYNVVNKIPGYIINQPGTLIGTLYTTTCQIAELDIFKDNFSGIDKYKIDYYMHLGDNIYSDILITNGTKIQIKYRYGEITASEFETYLNSSYNYLKAIYDEFLPNNWQEKSIMTWDDHDYGFNDTFREIEDEFKIIAFEQFCNFWNIPENDVRRNINRGVYYSKVINFDIFKIRFIMLDQTSQSNYNETDQNLFDSLGESQWQFLEDNINEFNENSEDLLIIGTPKQMYSTTWQGFNITTLNKFFNLLKNVNKDKILIYSGDSHANAITKIPNGGNQFIYEIQSGGRTNIRPPRIKTDDYFVLTAGEIACYIITRFIKSDDDKLNVQINIVDTIDNSIKSSYLI
jgi:hypothetical protein